MNLLMAEALDDEEYLLLTLAMQEDKQKEWNHRIPFDLEALKPKQVWDNFRFVKDDILQMYALLRFPEKVTTQLRFTAPGLETLCILLRRLAYPNRYSDISKIFNRSRPELSSLSNWAVHHIHETFRHLLEDIEQDWFLNSLQTFAEAINRKGSPLANCFGFIDGTVRPMCRPTRYQQDVYNGHKRTHALKFQSVVVPNGLILNLSGPYEGRRHDAYLLGQSNLMPKLAAVDALEGFCMFGDGGYGINPRLITPFTGVNLTDEQTLFNTTMSSMRQSVEWGFAHVLTYFAFIDFKKNLKLFLQPVGKYYLVAAILANCHTIKYGNQISSYFGVDPPTLEEYLV